MTSVSALQDALLKQKAVIQTLVRDIHERKEIRRATGIKSQSERENVEERIAVIEKEVAALQQAVDVKEGQLHARKAALTELNEQLARGVCSLVENFIPRKAPNNTHELQYPIAPASSMLLTKRFTPT